MASCPDIFLKTNKIVEEEKNISRNAVLCANVTVIIEHDADKTCQVKCKSIP